MFLLFFEFLITFHSPFHPFRLSFTICTSRHCIDVKLSLTLSIQEFLWNQMILQSSLFIYVQSFRRDLLILFDTHLVLNSLNIIIHFILENLIIILKILLPWLSLFPMFLQPKVLQNPLHFQILLIIEVKIHKEVPYIIFIELLNITRAIVLELATLT